MIVSQFAFGSRNFTQPPQDLYKSNAHCTIIIIVLKCMLYVCIGYSEVHAPSPASEFSIILSVIYSERHPANCINPLDMPRKLLGFLC